MGNKGQVTLFIIIGVILLLTAGLVIYLTTQKIVKPIEEKIIVPEGTEPIYQYISECVYQTAKEGIIQMGMQGGYLDLPAAIKNTPASYISLGGGFMIPYWYHNKQDKTPTLDFLAMEINSQLRQKLLDCIDFSNFAPQYEIRSKADFVPKTTITDEKVIIELIWPLEIITAGKTIRLDKTVKEVDVKLKEIYDIAKETMQFENRNAVFENITLGLLYVNPEIPTNGMEIDCGVKRWYLNEIETEMKNTLTYNIPSIKIENTPYTPFDASRRTYKNVERDYEDIIRALEKNRQPDFPENTPEDSYEYFKMLLDIGISPTEIKTGFSYRPEWGLNIVAYPHDGNVLKSNRIKGARKYLSYLCINQWHFVYDVEHPVVMTLKDSDAFKGEGYTFKFGFPVLINDNQAAREVVDRRPFLTKKYYYEFCGEKGEKIYDIRAMGIIPGAMFATELPDANITYECFDRYCDLGVTESDAGLYRLRTTLPTGCGNPFITAEKQGYLPETKQLTEDVLSIPLKRLKTMNYEIAIHQYDSRTNEYEEPRTKLKDTEQVSILIGLKDVDYYQTKTYQQGDTIDLVEGTEEYEINILLSRNEKLVGGYNREKVKIEYSELKDSNTIVFHVFDYVPVPLSDKIQMEMMQYLYEGAYDEVLKPTFQ